MDAGSSAEPGPVWPADLGPGSVTEVAPGVLRVVSPNPGMMTGPGTNTYVVGGDRLAVIDPGPETGLGAPEEDRTGPDRHLALICERFGDRISWILATHSHIDHSPLSRRLSEATGAPVIGFAPAPASAPPRPPDHGHEKGLDPHDGEFRPSRLMSDGERLDLGDLAIEAVHTPGHTSNHLCFEVAGTGLLFSGDHVMNGSTVVIAPPDGDMSAYLESLEKVRARPLRRIAPGHGGMIEDPAAVLDEYLRHRRRREEQVLGCIAAAPAEGATIEAIVAELYTAVPAKLHPVARYSVWAHLLKLASERRAYSPEPADISAPWFAGT